MPTGLVCSAGSPENSSPRPPDFESTTGSMMRKMPIVWMKNWTKSVSVIDHMPPSIE
jgi:hypothetical protein